MTATTDDGITIVYDGQCPFCAGYLRLLRLRSTVGPVRLVDARGGGDEVRAARDAGLDLDRGMVVRYRGATYFGDEAMHVLALLSTGSGLFNGAMRRIFGAPRAARVLYPALVAGRLATLRLLGRGRIGDAHPAPPIDPAGAARAARRRR